MISTTVQQALILVVAMLASGGIGFWIAREKYLGRTGKYEGHKPLPSGPVPRARMAPTVQ